MPRDYPESAKHFKSKFANPAKPESKPEFDDPDEARAYFTEQARAEREKIRNERIHDQRIADKSQEVATAMERFDRKVADQRAAEAPLKPVPVQAIPIVPSGQNPSRVAVGTIKSQAPIADDPPATLCIDCKVETKGGIRCRSCGVRNAKGGGLKGDRARRIGASLGLPSIEEIRGRLAQLEEEKLRIEREARALVLMMQAAELLEVANG